MAIIGAGLVGSSLALALRDSGLTLALVDSTPLRPDDDATAWDSRVYTINPGSVEFLHRIGVWERLDGERVTPLYDMRVWGDDGSAEIDFSALRSAMGELAWVVENRLLQAVLWEAMGEPENLHLCRPAGCADVEWRDDNAVVRLDDGQTLEVKLVVAADGIESKVRNAARLPVDTLTYPQLGVVANFASERPHRNTAYQWFRPDGVLAWLPLPGNRVSMVWSASEEVAQQLLACSTERLAETVAEAGGGLLGRFNTITPAACFPLRWLRSRSVIAPRLALVGDAAHGVHPLAGQGANLGFQDTRVLADVLMQRGAQTDCGDYYLLRRYERTRKEAVFAMQLVTDGLYRLFSNRDPLIKA
ncbi:MAG: UbiH/UbiF family hydroxylase, partial [Burkholderiales bacterium]